MKRVHVWVTGTVQGVWFRESTREQAQRRGLGGWVRNLSDGRVEAMFEGEPAAVDAVVEWCRTGPERARVESVDAEAEPPGARFGSFEVLR